MRGRGHIEQCSTMFGKYPGASRIYVVKVVEVVPCRWKERLQLENKRAEVKRQHKESLYNLFLFARFASETNEQLIITERGAIN